MLSAILFAVSLMSQKLVLTHGKIWSGDPHRRFVEAVAVEGNTIVAIGTNEEIMHLAPDAKLIDLHGRVAVPGFIDNHVHFVDGGFELSRVQLRDATPEEFARRIAEHAKKLGPGKWVTGGE